MVNHQYQLLDFGDGRKLERFGAFVLDRPSPPASGHPVSSELWNGADLRFELESNHRGNWFFNSRRLNWNGETLEDGFRNSGEQSQPPSESPVWLALPDCNAFQWICELNFGKFQLKCTPFGHVGLFPEHFPLWEGLAKECIAKDCVAETNGSPRVLSLFAYTGASSICFARAGATVTHVEAAKNVVQWARSNAQLSESNHPLPIRWLCEDVLAYVGRERKRRSTYEGIILDPPTYGHGPKGQVWKIERDLPVLLNDLASLTSQNTSFVLLTVHSSDYDTNSLRRLFQNEFLNRLEIDGEISAGKNEIPATELGGRNQFVKRLDSGVRLIWKTGNRPN